MNKQNHNFLTSCRHKVLAASIAACVTTLVATSVSQASDIDIYSNSTGGKVTLMLAIDTSRSMEEADDHTLAQKDFGIPTLPKLWLPYSPYRTRKEARHSYERTAPLLSE